jgi:hypothetical protein
MIEADQAGDELLKLRPDRDTDCEDVPGYLETEDRYFDAINKLVKTPAHSIEGLVAKARAVVYHRLQEDHWRHRAGATALAEDILRYFGAHVA